MGLGGPVEQDFLNQQHLLDLLQLSLQLGDLLAQLSCLVAEGAVPRGLLI